MDGEGEAIIIEEGGSGGGGEGGSEELDQDLDTGGGGEIEDQPGDDDGAGSSGGDDDQQRGGPSDIRKAIREFSTRDPDFAKAHPRFEKEITSALFTREQVNSLGGMRTLQDTLERLETHGGIEGIEEMAEEHEAAKQLERGLERGDSAVLQGWAKDFPDGFKRAAVPMLEGLEKLDETKFEQVASWLIDKTFTKFGVFSAVTELGKQIQAMKADDPAKAEAVKNFNELARFLGDTQKLGKNAKSDPYAGRSQELDQREQTLNQEAAKSFRSMVRTQVNTEVTKAMNDALRDYLKQNKIFRVEAKTADRMRKEINRELQRLVNSGQEYQKNYDSVMNSKDPDRALKFVMKNASKHLNAAIKNVVPDFNLKPGKRPGGGGPRRTIGTPAGRSNSGDQTKKVHGVPRAADVDFGRTPMDRYLGTKRTHGSAWLKSGELAEW